MPTDVKELIRRRIGFLTAALAACVVGMGLSYTVVRYLTQEFRMVHQPSPAAIQKATLLRAHTNALAALTEEYLTQIPLDAPSVSPAARQWVQQVFQKRLRDLRDRMDDERLVYLPPYRDLLAATERCTAMAAHPGNLELRRQTAAAVRLAAKQVNAYLQETGLAAHVSEPAHSLRGLGGMSDGL